MHLNSVLGMTCRPKAHVFETIAAVSRTLHVAKVFGSFFIYSRCSDAGYKWPCVVIQVTSGPVQ